jgi:RNA polymerase sigma factor (sigma-70 family)
MNVTEGGHKVINISDKEAFALKAKVSGAWADIFNRCHPTLMGIAARTVGPHDAEDVVMDGWERFMKKTESAGPDEVIGVDVLISAVTSESLSHLRKSKRRIAVLEKNSSKINTGINQHGVEDQAIAKVILENVIVSLNESGRARSVTVVLAGLGYAAPEISKLTGYTTGSVHQNLLRARRYIRKSHPDLASA